MVDVVEGVGVPNPHFNIALQVKVKQAKEDSRNKCINFEFASVIMTSVYTTTLCHGTYSRYKSTIPGILSLVLAFDIYVHATEEHTLSDP